MRPGRHGGMSSGEFELIIARNANFLTVRRAGSGDGQAGLYNSVTGDYVAAIGGGWIPEYSRMRNLKYGCACTPHGLCRSETHGTYLIRGWRNIAYELLSKRRIHASREIRRLLGSLDTSNALNYGDWQSPMGNPEAASA